METSEKTEASFYFTLQLLKIYLDFYDLKSMTKHVLQEAFSNRQLPLRQITRAAQSGEVEHFRHVCALVAPFIKQPFA